MLGKGSLAGSFVIHSTEDENISELSKGLISCCLVGACQILFYFVVIRHSLYVGAFC